MYFKLYKELENELEKEEREERDEKCISVIEKTQEWIEGFRTKIKKLSQDNINDIYLLMRYHQILERGETDESNTILTTLPYGSKQLKSSVKVDLEMMPEKLQKMIVLFVHKKSI